VDIAQNGQGGWLTFLKLRGWQGVRNGLRITLFSSMACPGSHSRLMVEPGRIWVQCLPTVPCSCTLGSVCNRSLHRRPGWFPNGACPEQPLAHPHRTYSSPSSWCLVHSEHLLCTEHYAGAQGLRGRKPHSCLPLFPKEKATMRQWTSSPSGSFSVR
jgi:hypothetical protein